MYDGNKAYHPSDSRVVEINREVRLKYELTSFDLGALILIKPRDVLLMTYPTFPPIFAPHSNRFWKTFAIWPEFELLQFDL